MIKEGEREIQVSKKGLLLGGAVLAAVAAAVGFFWPFGNRADILRLPGIVEIQEVRLGSKIGGRVKEISKKIGEYGSLNSEAPLEGAVVEAGQPLVIFDIPELEAQYEQAKASMENALADLEKTKITVPQEVIVAKATTDSAKAQLTQAMHDFARVEKLFQKESAAKSDYDAAVSARDRAKAEWEKAEAKWKELERTQTAEITLARTRWLQAQAKVKELKVNKDEAIVSAPKRARVEVVSVRTGDLIPPNQPIVRLLYLDDLWVKAYVPETELHKVRLNQRVEVLIDNSKKRFTGTVYYISPISEFTPRNVQSIDERHHQVFAIKIRVDNAEGIFHSGMAAEVLLPVREP